MKTCHDVSRLLSEAQDRRLGLLERLGLHLHLVACASCRHFAAQLDLLRAALRRRTAADPDARLSATARARIQAALDESSRGR